MNKSEISSNLLKLSKNELILLLLNPKSIKKDENQKVKQAKNKNKEKIDENLKKIDIQFKKDERLNKKIENKYKTIHSNFEKIKRLKLNKLRKLKR